MFNGLLGDLARAIADYDQAAGVYETLVDDEDRAELRNDLATVYNNRGSARAAQGDLARAIADYDKAVRIRETLVHKEDRAELEPELARTLAPRGLVRREQGDADGAVADLDRAFGLVRARVAGGERHHVPLMAAVAGDLAATLCGAGRAGEAVQPVRAALWEVRAELDADRATEVLRQGVGGLYVKLRKHVAALHATDLTAEEFFGPGFALGLLPTPEGDEGEGGTG